MDENQAPQEIKKSKSLTWKAWFGFSLLMVTAVLAAIIALGKVEMQTSYGLNIVLGSLATLSGNFAQWAFTHKDD